MCSHRNPFGFPMIAYRPSVVDDFEQILALLRQLWPTKELDPEALKAIFGRVVVDRLYLCAVDGDRVIGFGGISFRDNLWQEGGDCLRGGVGCRRGLSQQGHRSGDYPSVAGFCTGEAMQAVRTGFWIPAS